MTSIDASVAPTEHRLALSGGDLCWFEWGTAVPGQSSLLLLHAAGFHARCWDAVVAALPVGTHVIAPDLRGHGRSYRPASLGDWARTADDVVALVDGLDPKAPLVAVGHSMGGVCAIPVAAQRPERIAALVLVDPVVLPPEFYTAAGAEADPADHFVARRRNQWASATEMRERFAVRCPYAQWDAHVLADYCAWGLVPRAGGDGFELACPPLLEASAYLGSMRFNPHGVAASVDCRVAVLRGRSGVRSAELDFSISPTWPELACVFPEGSDTQWDDCTHFIPMEAPARLAAFIAAAAMRR